METLLANQRAAFEQCPMPSLAERRQKLLKLRSLLLQHRHHLAEAISRDFSYRSADEIQHVEIFPCIQHIDYTLSHLRRWMKPSRRRSGWVFWPATSSVMYQPLGVIGIITPFNYPIYLSMIPLATALAAGNRAMLKLSEQTPATAQAVRLMLGQGFSNDEVAVIEGDAEIAARFARLPFDHLFFTGSTHVGKLVMQAAAENLTPVTLELGGKSPAIFTADALLPDLIDRLCFAKTMNAGQTCVAPDYALIPREHCDAFIELLLDSYRRMFPALHASPDHTSIHSARSLQRLQELLRDASQKGAKIHTAGEALTPEGTFNMLLHVITDVTDDMKVMQQELFGPLLPVITYSSINEALNYVRQHPRPLALYLFSFDRNLQQQVATDTHSGALCINEALIHLGVADLPYGGIGPSGMGQYHGHEGFLNFSKTKAIFKKGRLNPTRLFYPPYGRTLQKWLLKLLMR